MHNHLEELVLALKSHACSLRLEKVDFKASENGLNNWLVDGKFDLYTIFDSSTYATVFTLVSLRVGSFLFLDGPGSPAMACQMWYASTPMLAQCQWYLQRHRGALEDATRIPGW